MRNVSEMKDCPRVQNLDLALSGLPCLHSELVLKPQQYLGDRSDYARTLPLRTRSSLSSFFYVEVQKTYDQ